MATIAILVEQDYQDMEVHYPRLRLIEAGHTVHAVGTGTAPMYKGKFGYPIKVDKVVSDVSATNYDAVVIPGGWAPDFLRRYPAMVAFVKEMDAQKKPIASICHGGWMLASADILKGRTATAFMAIKDDMIHAGANYVDQEVALDGNLITSRTPDDLPAFMTALLKQLG